MDDDHNKKLTKGYIWQCQACGKKNPGDLFNNDGLADYGWDESCILNAEQVPIARSTLKTRKSKLKNPRPSYKKV